MRTKYIPKSKTWAATVLASAGLLLAAVPAFALSIPGYSGKPWPNGAASASCMVESFGAVKNNCGQQVQWEIPVAVNPGLHSVSIYTLNPGGGTFQCFLYTPDGNGNQHTTPPSCFPNVNDDICNLNNVTVVSGGSMYVFCNINPGGEVFNVTYQ